MVLQVYAIKNPQADPDAAPGEASSSVDLFNLRGGEFSGIYEAGFPCGIGGSGITAYFVSAAVNPV